MYVLDVPEKIRVIPDQVLPIPLLPDTGRPVAALLSG
jgi:hypothetical protein